jgi:hypothetical protein
MSTMWQFTRHILTMPLHWQLWIFVLFMTNMAAVFFLPRVEASVVLGALALGAMLQMAFFARYGFVRLLGLGHFHWFPMVVWLWSRLGAIQSEGLFRGWIIAVIVVCGVSLMIDVVDVIRYTRGERKPTIVVAA